MLKSVNVLDYAVWDVNDGGYKTVRREIYEEGKWNALLTEKRCHFGREMPTGFHILYAFP